MRPFENISGDQVTALHKLIRVLRRLDVIGKVITTTEAYRKPVSAIDFAERLPNNCYTIKYDGYDPSRDDMRSEMMLEKIFDHKMSTDSWPTHFKF